MRSCQTRELAVEYAVTVDILRRDGITDCIYSMTGNLLNFVKSQNKPAELIFVTATEPEFIIVVVSSREWKFS